MDKKEVGKIGEDAAAQYLLDAGYEILDRNWRTGRMEIDIIAKQADTIIVVEVKTRRSDQIIKPAASVSPSQMRRLADAYTYYADQKDYNGDCRFDVIGVLFINIDQIEIDHYEDAFFPGA